MAYTGIYERTIFYNPVNKYSVISVKTSDRSIPEKARSAYRHRDNMIHFAAVGYELPRTDQVSMILDGEWKEGKNGFQLHVTKCEEVVPQTREGIKGYLSSRLIKGIGGKTAELIVDRFGADTLHVLENEPERLLEIRGVSKAKLEEIIASYTQLRRDLIVGNADAGGDPQLKLDPLADLFSNTHGRTEQTDAAGHIQPAFIKAKRFDLVGVFLVNLASHLTESDILPHIGRQHHQIGTKLLRLPDGHACFDATWLCYIVGSKDDSVTGFWITADCHRLLTQFRATLTFHGCIKCVHIYV